MMQYKRHRQVDMPQICTQIDKADVPLNALNLCSESSPFESLPGQRLNLASTTNFQIHSSLNNYRCHLQRRR